jgi:hypothetical protein
MDVEALLFFLKLVVPNINPMKKQLLLLFVLLSVSKMNSQVVFCPPGAEWRYEFTVNIFIIAVTNEFITYTGYNVIGSDTIKTLSHSKFYLSCNEFNPTTTSIKQRGDTIYFQNHRTQNTWQILYNFAAQVGQGWQTTILRENNTPITFAYIVDSIGYVNINGLTLKRLYLNNKTQIITERIGNSDFLFNYSNANSYPCDGDYFRELLCYSDSTLGTKQFSNKPCDYSNLTDLSDYSGRNNKISFFPNPTHDVIHVNIENSDFNSNYELVVFDALGQKSELLDTVTNQNKEMSLDLSLLNSGLYFARIYENKKLLANQKIMKQ